MACCRQNNSCGCGNNGWNNDSNNNNRNDCFIGNRCCRRELDKAVDTLMVIQDLADDFLEDFFDDNNCRCGCGCRRRNECRCDRNERNDRDERNNRCGCGCGCNNYWGR